MPRAFFIGAAADNGVASSRTSLKRTSTLREKGEMLGSSPQCKWANTREPQVIRWRQAMAFYRTVRVPSVRASFATQ